MLVIKIQQRLRHTTFLRLNVPVSFIKELRRIDSIEWSIPRYTIYYCIYNIIDVYNTIDIFFFFTIFICLSLLFSQQDIKVFLKKKKTA